MARLDSQWKNNPDHERRIRWWREARFGMFIHWGVYAVHGRGEWALNVDQIPIPEYEKLAAKFTPEPRCMRSWAKLARDAGMKHMVLTAKHHEGFCLWDTKQTRWNSMNYGPKRDLFAEYVDACREFGLKCGVYYSLMDWHHPDGARCALNRKAYDRFIDFTHGCVRELMSNYGKIDILWYDLAWPFMSIEEWQSPRLNRMVRKLQPDILINDRSLEPQDFCTAAEGHIKASEGGRDWECCMTTTGSWGYAAGNNVRYMRACDILSNLRACACGKGNLLLNVGPDRFGHIPDEAAAQLRAAGAWLKTYGKYAVHGDVDSVNMRGGIGSSWFRQGKDYYLVISNYNGPEHAVGRLKGKVLSAELMPTGKRLKVEQTPTRVVFRGLPPTCPDKTAGIALIRVRFATTPSQGFGIGYVTLPAEKKGKQPEAAWIKKKSLWKPGK